MTKTNTQLQGVDINQIQTIGEFGVAELMSMKESIAKKLSIPQFNLFMYQVNRMGLDPSLGHAVPILYGQDVNIRIEYEGWKSLAQKSEGYSGIFTQEIRENDDFSAESDEDGVLTKVTYKMGKLPRGKVIGSYAVAKREGHKDVIIVCEIDDFEKYAKKNPSFWKLDNGTIDPDMARKFVGTRAVKAQFDVTQVVEGNMASLNVGNEEETYEPRRVDITEEANATINKIEQPKPRQSSEEKEIKAIRVKVSAAFKELGIAEPDGMTEYMNNNAKPKGETPTLQEWKSLLRILELDVEEKKSGGGNLDPLV